MSLKIIKVNFLALNIDIDDLECKIKECFENNKLDIYNFRIKDVSIE